MEKCSKCGIPATQLYSGTCIECMLLQPHRDPEPVTYDEKLKALLQDAGRETFFSGMGKMWAGSILVRYSAIPMGRAPMYMYFDRARLVTLATDDTTGNLEEKHIGITDMSIDSWHILPEDMEADAPITGRQERATTFFSTSSVPEWSRFIAHCEHADTWMQQ